MSEDVPARAFEQDLGFGERLEEWDERRGEGGGGLLIDVGGLRFTSDEKHKQKDKGERAGEAGHEIL